jgi:hypothetical protein
VPDVYLGTMKTTESPKESKTVVADVYVVMMRKTVVQKEIETGRQGI